MIKYGNYKWLEMINYGNYAWMKMIKKLIIKYDMKNIEIQISVYISINQTSDIKHPYNLNNFLSLRKVHLNLFYTTQK